MHELQIRNLPVHIETCGAYPIQGEMDWITLSPKKLAPPLEENLKIADEFKLIVENENSIQSWSESINFSQYGIPTWLHPEWSVSRDSKILSIITNWIKEYGAPYRAGFQLHKLFEADEKDERSMPVSSLCKNPS